MCWTTDEHGNTVPCRPGRIMLKIADDRWHERLLARLKRSAWSFLRRAGA